VEPSSAPDLAARVTRLERSSLIRDASGSATLTSQGLTVRDPSGRERAFIGVNADKRPSVDLADSTGRLRESMSLLNELPVLRMFDTAGKRRAEIGLNPNNDGELLLRDRAEKLRLALFRTGAGDPQLTLYGSDENRRAVLATDDGSPYLVMKDSTATTRVYLGGYAGGTMGMDIRDAANTVLWKTP
jgi:hypothetical protein